MNVQSILLLAAVLVAFLAVLWRHIKKGGSGCSCGCDGCDNCQCPNTKAQHKQS